MPFLPFFAVNSFPFGDFLHPTVCWVGGCRGGGRGESQGEGCRNRGCRGGGWGRGCRGRGCRGGGWGRGVGIEVIGVEVVGVEVVGVEVGVEVSG